ncbi:hypothetical protein BDN72DRAFT_780754 [Pluteus cervinus]|uniref:Uncharacterized protein n=1 Tax=Pluteus cervinus TaxID=181527 RepID=A0ACD3A160_9AGAR|nr:hypothetical protein BDN72DRAFT_780754 [Pluteus cervinus]
MFLALHYVWYNRYCEQGDGAPADVHPSSIVKLGATKVNFNQRIPYPSKDMSQNPEEYDLLKGILSPFSHYLDSQLQRLLPEEYTTLSHYADTLPLHSVAPAYPFTGFVLNFCVSTSAHRDPGDQSVCAVMPFGDFTGGQLCLYEAGLVFDMQPGDIIIFPSAKITHFNLHFDGTRGSFVFQTDRKFEDWITKRNGWPHIVEHSEHIEL